MESNRKPQWTPGPWVLERNSARIEVRTSPDTTYAFTHADDANARLIAEAPAMAEALRQLVDAIEDCVDDGGLPRDAENSEAMRNARAILASIEGK